MELFFSRYSFKSTFKDLFWQTVSFFATLVLLFYGSFALAKAPDYCFGYQNIQFVNLGEYSKDAPAGQALVDLYSCSDFKRFDELGGKINDLLGYKNPGTDFIVTTHVRDAKDTYSFDHLIISIEQKHPDDLQYIDTIYVHEWSHAVLNRYLQDRLPLFKNFLPLRARSEELEKISFQVVQLIDENGACTSEKCKQFFTQNQNLFGEIDANSNAINNYMDSIQSALAILVHYHELFADFVPALYYSNPDIARQTMMHFFGADPIEFSDCRSFLFSAPSGFKLTEPHCSLSGVRKQISKKILNATTTQEKKLLARKFLEMIAQQVELQIERTSGWTEKQINQFPDDKAISDLSAAIEKL